MLPKIILSNNDRIDNSIFITPNRFNIYKRIIFGIAFAYIR